MWKLVWAGLVPMVLSFLLILVLGQMGFLKREFAKLLKIVSTLKFKQFEHETQLLGRAGVYVPEDSAEFVYNVIWGMIDENEKKFLENEYKEKCPSHIPIWKFVLYNYKLTTTIVPKEPAMVMSHTENLMSNMYEMEQMVDSYIKTVDDLHNSTSEIKKSLNKVSAELTDMESDL